MLLKMNNVDMPIGHEMEIAIQKNKTAPPNRSCELTIHIQNAENYKAGSTDEIAQVIAHAEKWGVIERKGAWYQLSKDHKAQGVEQSTILLAETPALLQAIKDATWQAEMKYLGNVDD
jgi:recombination protein RecA